jgi:hypothetical protein
VLAVIGGQHSAITLAIREELESPGLETGYLLAFVTDFPASRFANQPEHLAFFGVEVEISRTGSNVDKRSPVPRGEGIVRFRISRSEFATRLAGVTIAPE